MRPDSEPKPPNPDQLRQRCITCQAVAILRTMLPPLSEDTPEARACRDDAALDPVAALVPGNAAEARGPRKKSGKNPCKRRPDAMRSCTSSASS